MAFPSASVPEIEEFTANIMYSINTSAFHAIVEHSIVTLYPKAGLECGEKVTSAFCDSIGEQEKEVI